MSATSTSDKPGMDVSVEGVTDTSAVVVPDPVLANGHVDQQQTDSSTSASISNGTTKDQAHTSAPSPSSSPPPFTLDTMMHHRNLHHPMPSGVAAFADSSMFKSTSGSTVSKPDTNGTTTTTTTTKTNPKPKAKTWSAHFSTESRSRHGSSLKSAAQYLGRPALISLGGGLPSSDYFPLETLSIKIPQPPQFSEVETAVNGTTLAAHKHDTRTGASVYDLSIALNYGQATGSAQLLRFVTEHTELIHQPPYQDWACCLTSGSTSALENAYRVFCSPPSITTAGSSTSGDGTTATNGHGNGQAEGQLRKSWILTEEYSFATALETAQPLGIGVVGVAMDEQGLLPAALDKVLTNWDENGERAGASRPFVLYTVPTGQNPTGATQGLQRRKDIYELADKWDLLILEDEPYFFLQVDPYSSGSSSESESTSEVNDDGNGVVDGSVDGSGSVEDKLKDMDKEKDGVNGSQVQNGTAAPAPAQSSSTNSTTNNTSDSTTTTTASSSTLQAFLAALIPSYLSLDKSGRVVRLDSFSKIIAPGTRTGWITAPAEIVERFVRHHEVSTQNPSGISQMVLYKLLDEGWGHRGFLEWLFWLRGEYARRRDGIVRACEKFLPEQVCSWVPPRAGMFHWIRVEWALHPTVKDLVQQRRIGNVLGGGVNGHNGDSGDSGDGRLGLTYEEFLALEERIFLAAVDRGVLCSRGSWFRAEKGTDTEMFFRTTFAAAGEEQITEAIRRFGEALRAEFQIEENKSDKETNGHALSNGVAK